MIERKLLLVDDEENIQNALKRILRREGYEVRTASNALEGLALLEREEMGVIVSDYRMPGMTGVEFFDKVKSLYPETVRIILSGYAEIKAVTAAINKGWVYKFVLKPWDDADMRAHIKEAFERFEAMREKSSLELSLSRANQSLQENNRQLEGCIKDKARELDLRLRILQGCQEMIEYLPFPVLGMGADGIIALANARAHQFLPLGNLGLIGMQVESRLPATLCALVRENGDAEEGLRRVRLDPDRDVLVYCQAMQGKHRGQGKFMIILPVGLCL